MHTDQVNSASRHAFSHPRKPDCSQTPEYTITTVHPSGSDLLSRIPVHDLEGPESASLMPVPAGREGEGLLLPGGASHELAAFPVWNEDQGIPESRAHAQSESRGIFQNLLDPIRQKPLPAVPVLPGEHPDESWHPPRTRTRELMELPRGRFRALKRNTGLLFLIRDMLNERFTGYCKIQLAKTPMLLVFGSGKILLASYRNLAGDAALEQILEHQYSWVDAMLHDLDEPQIQLALEFNAAWRVSGERSFISSEMGGIEDSLESPAVQDPHPNVPSSGGAGKNTALVQGEEDSGWRRAIMMGIGPAEVAMPAGNRSEAGTDESAIRFESLGSDSDLFERRSVRTTKKGAPEPSEQWRSMSVNSLQNDSV